MINIFSRTIFIILLCSNNYILADVIGFKKVICLRVEFQESESSGTTGDGQFLMNPDTTCGSYIIDPPPHNKSYFTSQLRAVNNYFQSVSYQKFGIDLEQSQIFPEANDSTYILPFPMEYYNPYGESDELKESRLVKLFKDAVSIADSLNGISFLDYDFVIVFHAGIGQDFSLPYLDPTPEDIPSTYVDRDMLGEPFIGVEHGIIIPETENHLLFDEGNILFDQASEPCDYQYGLTGVLSLMIGFASGLPPLWDLDSGESRIGIFGLMDQGSNNGRGLIPSPPDAWTRVFAGWESPFELADWSSEFVLAKRSENSIIKVNLTNTEHFMVENRNNWIYPNVSIDSLRYALWEESERYPPFIEILIDSVDIERDDSGVITKIPNYDLGLPASGLLIWHIDNELINEGISDYSVNSDRVFKGVDLEEADGAQDIGYPSIFMFQDPSSGYFGDMWFSGNLEYKRMNSGYDTPEFGLYTFPNTKANNGADSYLRFFDISEQGDTMNFSVSNLHQLGGFPDSTAYFHGAISIDTDQNVIGGRDSIWWAPISDPVDKRVFYIKHALDASIFISHHYKIDGDFLYVIEHKESSSIINYFEWEEYEKNFLLIEQSIVDSIVYIIPDLDTDLVDSINYNSYLSNLETAVVIQDNDTVTYSISENNLRKESTVSGEKITYFNNNLINLIAVDLDLDGRGDAVLLDETGTLFAIDQNGFHLPGFPLEGSFDGNILASQILDDSHPEIIVEDLNQRKIFIIDWSGNIELSFPLSTNDKLKFISDNLEISSDNFSKVISTTFSLWSFPIDIDENSQHLSRNQWTFPNADMGHSRLLELNYSILAPDNDYLFDSNRTYVYPNPSTENIVKIRVQVESANNIECKIYNLAGFYIDTILFNDPIQGMVNEIVWDVSDLESGIYYIDLTAQDDNITQSKLIKAGIVR